MPTVRGNGEYCDWKRRTALTRFVFSAVAKCSTPWWSKSFPARLNFWRLYERFQRSHRYLPPSSVRIESILGWLVMRGSDFAYPRYWWNRSQVSLQLKPFDRSTPHFVRTEPSKELLLDSVPKIQQTLILLNQCIDTRKYGVLRSSR